MAFFRAIARPALGEYKPHAVLWVLPISRWQLFLKCPLSKMLLVIQRNTYKQFLKAGACLN